MKMSATEIDNIFTNFDQHSNKTIKSSLSGHLRASVQFSSSVERTTRMQDMELGASHGNL